MRDLHRAYLDGHLSRRSFFQGLIAAGFTTAAAGSLVESAETGATEVDLEDTLDGPSYQVSGTGSDLLTEQVRAAGSKYIFTNPGSMESGFFDALTDREDLQVIMGLHEGIVIPMADSFNMVTGYTCLRECPHGGGHGPECWAALQCPPPWVSHHRHGRAPGHDPLQRRLGARPGPGLQPDRNGPAVHQDLLGGPQPSLHGRRHPAGLQGGLHGPGRTGLRRLQPCRVPG